jgi:hypothetical protein
VSVLLPRLLVGVGPSYEAEAAGWAYSGRAHVFERQGHARSRRRVFDIDDSRRDSLRVKPEDHVPPAVVGKDVPDLQCRKAHPAAGVFIDVTGGSLVLGGGSAASAAPSG